MRLGAIVNLPGVYTDQASAATVTVTGAASSSATAISHGCDDDSPSRKMTLGLGFGLGIGLPLVVALLVSWVFLGRARRRIQLLEQQRNYQILEKNDGGPGGTGVSGVPGGHRDVKTTTYVEVGTGEADGREIYEVSATN